MFSKIAAKVKKKSGKVGKSGKNRGQEGARKRKKKARKLLVAITYGLISWWPDQESNQGHKDFQSSALPSELSGQVKN